MANDLHRRLEAWLRYGDELGLGPFYRDRARTTLHTVPADASSGTQPPEPGPLPVSVSGPLAAVPSLFDGVESVPNDSLERIRTDLGDCTRCRLHRSRTKIVFGTGNPRAELVFVGEGPGHDEDQQGEPFVGRAGQLLTQMIEAMGLSRSDVYICNVVKCRPPENRTPARDEIATCAPFLLRQLAVIRPRVIVCLGAVAAQTLLGFSASISRLRGQWYDYRGARLLATYHPAYLLRNPSAKVEVWSDLKQVMAALGLKPPPPRPRQRR
ncbi:MAG: uracil-DNA glycosylase [Firmicutes bacterium]|nr:uracil-DNA glycosylase [Bacillota bacterium]